MCVQASVQEVLGSSDGESALQMMTKDQYANYVVQKMLEVITCWQAVLCCGLNHCVSMLCCAAVSLTVSACCAVLWCHSLCQHAVLWSHSLSQHAVLWCTWSVSMLCCGALVESACCAVLSLIVPACCAVVYLVESACCAVVYLVGQHAVLWCQPLCQHAGGRCITTPYRVCLGLVVSVSCRVVSSV